MGATVMAYQYRKRPLIRYRAIAAAIAISVSLYTGRAHFISEWEALSDLPPADLHTKPTIKLIGSIYFVQGGMARQVLYISMVNFEI